MSFSKHYDRAASVGREGRELFEVFGPATVLAMMRRVDNGTIVLARDMAANPPSESLQLAFSLFKAGWAKFYEEHKGWTGWVSRGFNTTYDMVESYGKQLNAYRAAFIKEGGKTSLPVLVPRKSRSGIELSLTKTVLTAALGGLAILFIGRRLF